MLARRAPLAPRAGAELENFRCASPEVPRRLLREREHTPRGVQNVQGREELVAHPEIGAVRARSIHRTGDRQRKRAKIIGCHGRRYGELVIVGNPAFAARQSAVGVTVSATGASRPVPAEPRQHLGPTRSTWPATPTR